MLLHPPEVSEGSWFNALCTGAAIFFATFVLTALRMYTGSKEHEKVETDPLLSAVQSLERACLAMTQTLEFNRTLMQETVQLGRANNAALHEMKTERDAERNAEFIRRTDELLRRVARPE